MLVAIRIWLTILVCWPAPAGPWWTIVLPMVSKSGRRASTTSFSPPIMIDSRASRAPTSPPETGASTACTLLGPRPPRRSRRPAPARWWSCRRAPCPAWRRRACRRAPSVTSRTSCGIADDREDDVRRRGDRPGRVGELRPPSRPGPWSSRRVRLKTVAWYPAAIRCPHIDEPMTPVPIQPIRVFPGANSSAIAGSRCAASLERGRPRPLQFLESIAGHIITRLARPTQRPPAANETRHPPDTPSHAGSPDFH